jgi:hypothetical protein
MSIYVVDSNVFIQAHRVIVTHEVAAPNATNKIKIPDACDALHVGYVNTMEMFRQLGESF